MATPLKVLTALSASYGAAVSGSTGLIVQQGGLQVQDGNISGSADLTLVGNAGIGGDLTIAGNLTVNGTTTTVNTENLLVEDKNIILGNGLATDDSLADGGGITLSGSTNKTFTWSNSTDSWTSSENMDLASAKTYKLAGDIALQTNTRTISGAPTPVKEIVSSSLASVSVGGVSGLGAASLSSSYQAFIFAGSKAAISSAAVELTGAVGLNSTLRVAGVSTFLGPVTSSAGLSGTIGNFTQLFVNGEAVGLGSGDVTAVLAGSSNLTGGGSSGELTIDLANNISISSVTASVGVSASVFVLADGTRLSSSQQLGGGGGGDATNAGVESAYNALRYVTSGTLDANGYAQVDLTAVKASEFAVANLNKLSVDVMTSPSGSGLGSITYWNNDLVSVKLENSASALWAKIDAPAAPESYYRLIVINESDFNVV